MAMGIYSLAFPQNLQGIDFICAEEFGSQEPKSTSDIQYRPYIPYGYTGFIPIRVNMIFLQKDNGEGGFQATNSEHQRLFDEIEEKVNYIYANLVDSDTSVCFQWKDKFLSTAKVKFLFKRVYIKDTYAWNRNNYNRINPRDNNQCPPLEYINYLQQQIENDNSIPLGINVFFTEDSTLYELYAGYGENMPISEFQGTSVACSEFPRTGEHSQIHMEDIYCKYLWMKYCVPRINNVSWIPTVWGWLRNALAAGLAHELGHSLDLSHYCNHYNTNQCPHALMHQANISPQHLRNYIPPTEIGKIHIALMETHLQNFVDKDLSSVGTMNITHDLVWNAPFRCYADLNISQSGSVDLTGAVQMPKKSKIEVRGQLYIRNSDIQCANASDSWQGIIRVKSGGLLYLENVTISGYDIIMESGSTLILSGSMEFKNGHKAVLGSGVYVCVASSFTDKSVSKSFFVNGTPSTVLNNGKASGVTSKYAVSCTASGWLKFVRRCVEIQETLYIQNNTINQDETFVAKTILIGNSVDENQTKGDVVIKSPARATFIYRDRILFDKGFRCESGGSHNVLQYK